MENIEQETVDTFHWIFSEIWNIYILARLGYYDMIEEKIERLLLFLKENGITEAAMSLEDDLNKESLISLINKFKK